jgi:hypothetical protein
MRWTFLIETLCPSDKNSCRSENTTFRVTLRLRVDLICMLYPAARKRTFRTPYHRGRRIELVMVILCNMCNARCML